MIRAKFDGIEDAQIEALMAFRARHGRFWKAALLTAWMNGSDASEPGGSALRRLRNCSGPTWLDTLRPKDLAAERDRRSQAHSIDVVLR
ncbi:hypothetical protein GCM10007973_02130 [Polymorphobacter multimanifer]|jgi:hypothetical protein|uniref:Uncharacterized protein n=1 Tax=Polymorphobacter multimanifer TaxID=1070431 RepID=A0A841L7P5_9SPHN|nr:hypothetical protein [Polymorphobacter multimanifer]MBB6228594.1 hypothetical protein [Polymorphobacter multimanifer]GGI68622.1 hypothetical protein GCM10007973_02130 [Polymorphobacter multimanifer]